MVAPASFDEPGTTYISLVECRHANPPSCRSNAGTRTVCPRLHVYKEYPLHIVSLPQSSHSTPRSYCSNPHSFTGDSVTTQSTLNPKPKVIQLKTLSFRNRPSQWPPPEFFFFLPWLPWPRPSLSASVPTSLNALPSASTPPLTSRPPARRATMYAFALTPTPSRGTVRHVSAMLAATPNMVSVSQLAHYDYQ